MNTTRRALTVTIWLIFALWARSGVVFFTPILPSLCALTLVVVFRSALVGLAGGALVGAVLIAPQTIGAPVYLVNDLLLPALQSRWNLCVLMFTLVMGGFVGLLDAGGGMAALVRRLVRRNADGSSRIQWITYGLGFGCFFDGLANSMLVGSTMRPLFERTGIDRTRLAYIVDSTSSPIACVAFLSTWIAYQLSMIREGLTAAGIEANPYRVFLAAIPGNYYCWFTLALVGIVIAQNWSPVSPGPASACEPTAPERAPPEPESRPGLHVVWIPLAFLLLALPAGLWWSGHQALAGQPGTAWVDTFAAADTPLVLVMAGLGASLVAAVVYPRSTSRSAGEAFVGGMERLLSPALILVSAWALSGSLRQLGAGDWIGAALSGSVPGWLLPALVFVVGAAISFLTGTSWGTMGILVPLDIPLGAMAEPATVSLEGVGIAVLAAAFSGAVFGDHCSPISDTTIVSSLAAGVSSFDHVRTQLPYALTAAGVALCPGFLLAGLTGSPWPGLAAGLICLAAWHQRLRVRTD